MSNVFEAVVCDTDSAFEREALAGTIKRIIGVEDSETARMRSAVSSATPFQRYIVSSAVLFDNWFASD